MKGFISFGILSSVIFFNQCVADVHSSGNLLSPTDFQQKIIELPNAPIIDVRTPGEFTKAHLQHAVNVDLNSDRFAEIISRLDQSKPVLLYCFSGSRSETAAEQLRSMGFTQVYELAGGIMKWQAADLPVVSNTFGGPQSKSTGMTRAEFENKLSEDKLTLVDFYASWCSPCRKMRPAIDEIAVEMKDKVEVLMIDADAHPQLCKDLDVGSLPTLLLYKNKNLTWENRGYLDKAEIVKALH